VAEPLRETALWRRLQWHHAEIRHLHLRELLRDDPTRGNRLTAEAAGISLDYSKHLVRDDTLGLLRKLAAERGLGERVRAMFRGEPVNVSEGRPALHVALRMPASRSVFVDGVDVVKEVHAELDRMSALGERVRAGDWLGATGKPVRNVVNVGIGGSDLGPRLAYEALLPYAMPGLTARFVANVDPADLARATSDLDPEETLVVVVSKTMSTLETLENARAVRAWLTESMGEDVGAHLVGVTAGRERAEELGFLPEQVFRTWDWVGGRTSLCSAVGLSTLVAVGADRFRELLAGFHAMDGHFAGTPLGANLPAISGLLSVWYRGFFAVQTKAVVPYSHALRLLPEYLQELEMESLGKRVTEHGEPVGVDTGAVVWGGVGTSAQHAGFQLLHQGTTLVPLDLVLLAQPTEGPGDRHDLLAAAALGQAEALALGRTAEELEAGGAPDESIPHRVSPGNRPTSLVMARKLTPATLGALISLYEHAVFTQAAIWGIDPFDQWGVELGKELGAAIAPELAPGWKRELLHDPSTNAAIARYRRLRDAVE
jgi:glucose-6-phosphate isomerase